MTPKRYALFMASYTNLPAFNYPINADTCYIQLEELRKAFINAFGNGDYSFSWPGKASNQPEPEILGLTPDTGQVTIKIEELDGIIAAEDIFLFYYFGHGYINKTHLCLAFQHFSPEKNPELYSIKIIVDRAIKCGAKNIIIILDCCYGAQSNDYLGTLSVNYHLLSASYKQYSFHNHESGGAFTKELISILNSRNIEQYSQPRADALTLGDLFTAIENGLSISRQDNSHIPVPYNKGNLKDFALLPITKTTFTKPAFDIRAKFNTIYKKLFVICEYLFDKAVTLDNLYNWITLEKQHTSFKISENEYIDKTTVLGYLNTLHKLKFLKTTDNGGYTLDVWGVLATKNNGAEFNKFLIRSLFNWLTSKTLTWDEVSDYRMKIQKIFKDDLILKLIVPNYEHFEEVFFKKNQFPMIDKKDVKLILQLYSFTEDLQRMDSNTYFL